jgi:ribonuclease Z
MTSRQFIVLGTASQAPTRHRHHNSYALRWDELLVLFDPGEGTQRQCILAGVAIARADAVCITHFHGDHCLGLPGVIQRRALDNRSSAADPAMTLGPLPVVFPAEGASYFERLRSASVFHDTSEAYPVAVDGDGSVLELGPTATLSARRLDHRVPTFGYRIDEPDGVRIDAEALAGFDVSGPDVGRLVRDGTIETDRGTIGLEQVSKPKPGQSMAFIMDTRLCRGAEELADGVDLLVCESTFLESEAALAARFRHLTARQAATLARDAGARRLLLTHFSARYADGEVFGDEARAVHDDVVVASDLATVPVPARR